MTTMLFPHQREAFAELDNTAAAFFRGAWRNYPVVPRFNRIVVGPSGSGKTHLVRKLAQERGMPILEISSTCWIPLGCAERGARQTWRDIFEFCEANERGIIFIDELDKLGGETTSWVTFIRVEVFLLLDRMLPGNFRVPADGYGEYEEEVPSAKLDLVRDRLRRGIFLVGGGAFQDLWRTLEGKRIGFSEKSNAASPPLDLRVLTDVVPTEIANRFVSPPIVLHPLKREDYHSLLKVLCRAMPRNLEMALRKRGAASLEDAMQSGLGCRWAERLVLDVLVADAAQKISRRKIRLAEKPGLVIEEGQACDGSEG